MAEEKKEKKEEEKEEKEEKAEDKKEESKEESKEEEEKQDDSDNDENDDDSSDDSEKEESDNDSENDSDDEEEEEVEIDERFEDIVAEIEKMSVVELADLVKAIEKKFGVSAAAPAAAAGGGAGGGGGQSAFNVVITDPGGSKIQVIKAVKEITGKGLKESKAMVDDTPATIQEGLGEDEANELKEQLEEAGATVELQ